MALLSTALERLEHILRFFSVYSKLGAAKQALDSGSFWIDEVDEVDQLAAEYLSEFDPYADGLDVSDLSEDDSRETSLCTSSVLEFDLIDDEDDGQSLPAPQQDQFAVHVQ
jgi:hypothetical protein